MRPPGGGGSMPAPLPPPPVPLLALLALLELSLAAAPPAPPVPKVRTVVGHAVVRPRSTRISARAGFFEFMASSSGGGRRIARQRPSGPARAGRPRRLQQLPGRRQAA